MEKQSENLKDYFDHDALVERLGGNEEIVEELMQTFLESTEEDLETLSNLIENENSKEISIVAHKLKGRILNMSMSKEASDAAKFLELNADKMTVEEMKAKSSIVEKIFLQIKKLYKN
ncbi:MAG: Hpt domain-containing protein [Candidatus Cloacimonadota bacterium]|nr:Hpt domain-containing protein [Candidatus Cloacimonadota bacterium]